MRRLVSAGIVAAVGAVLILLAFVSPAMRAGELIPLIEPGAYDLWIPSASSSRSHG